MKSRKMPIGVPTPVVGENRLFVTSFYDGSMLIRIDPRRPAAEKLWHRVGIDEKNTDALHAMISTPLIKGQYIYGVDSYGQLRCLDIETGDRIWEDTTAVPTARWATIHIIQAGDREIMLNDRGELIDARLTPQGFHEQSRGKLIEPTRKQLNRRNGVVWAHPAIADGIIYARNDRQLIAASLR
jgi:outer membrane protein assembly factor BamB